MIERNRSGRKYVEIFIHRVGCIGAPSRTVFVRRTNAKLWDVPNIARRDTKTNIFQEGSAGFKATIGLNNNNNYYGGNTSTNSTNLIIVM
jgi:hypothetical protein